MTPGLYRMENGQMAVMIEVRDGCMLGRTPHFEAMWFVDGSEASHQETGDFGPRRGPRTTTA